MELERDALYCINKPLDKTSFYVVLQLRNTLSKYFKEKKLKVGHAGTLDPKATGLLIICTGKKTKEIDQFMGLPKEYTAEICIGATRVGYDMEGEIVEEFDISNITAQQITAAAAQLTGTILQTPPPHSAVMIDGKRAYELARAGKEVEIAPREVTIHYFDITYINLPYIGCRIGCSKGTYIRSLAHDFGKILNNGAHLTGLQRTKIGDYKLEEAWNLEEFITFVRSKMV